MKKTKAAGERLQDVQSINSSLLELGLVSDKIMGTFFMTNPYFKCLETIMYVINCINSVFF